MSDEPRHIYVRSAKRVRSRLRVLAAWSLAGIALAASVWLVTRIAAGNSHDARLQPAIMIARGTQKLAVGRTSKLRAMSDAQLRSWIAERVGVNRVVRRGRSRITLRVNRKHLLVEIRRAASEGIGTVRAHEKAIAARTPLRVMRQALRNNCETASLSMLLLADGIHVDQLALQRQLPRSGPLDPQPSRSGGLPVWGDPEQGFVGRVAGGGSSGGYGVYEDPIRALAHSKGAELTKLSRRPVTTIYKTLLAGRPVIAWVGLANGPFKSWRTPGGKLINANLGEHAVVLTGLHGSTISVNDPLSGKNLTWTKDRFELMWKRLGRRALAS